MFGKGNEAVPVNPQEPHTDLHDHTDEKLESHSDFQSLTDEELKSYAETFLGEEVITLSQEEIDAKLKPLLIELAQRELNSFRLLSFILPKKVTAEEIQSGNSSWAKVYKSLFNLSKTTEYKQTPELQMIVRELENTIDQNPQMMGPVAMWEIAKDIMWRKDVPSHAKGSLMGSMTYALAFFDTESYEAELLKKLDFEDTENYAEVAHMLEALKQFWSSGHESYAEDRVPDFYLRALKKIEETPEANYLLSVRAKEILSILNQSEDFPVEARDLKPFELSKGIFASTQVGEGLTVIPENVNEDVIKAMNEFDTNEKKIKPPQWMVNEAIANGETWVYWQAPRNLMQAREQLFDKMHQYATTPIESQLGTFSNLEASKKEAMIFDYEYLVSRPIRDMIQREFDFELKDLSIREQFYFLNYLKRVTVGNVDTMKQFTGLYGVDGMRTFLSLERGDETLGDQIIAFGQHEEVARTVFQYYGELLDSAERAETLVREVSDCEGDACVELANQVRENIMHRAQRDLEKAVRAHDPSAVAQQIETYVVSAKEYVALLQEVGGLIESTPAQHVSPQDKDEMIALQRNRYEHIYPNEEDRSFREDVFASLRNAFDKPNVDFNILKHQEHVVCFNRFETRKDTTGKEVSYFGSFNAHPAYSGVGQVMLEQTVAKRLEDGRPMMGQCDPTQEITKKYIENGFIATSLDYDIAGHPDFEIWRSNNSSVQFETKNKTVEELVSPDTQSESVIVREQSESEAYPELREGKALTRYFIYEGKTYLVFETLPETLRAEFTYQKEEAKEAA